MPLSKAQLARLAFARLREIAPNEVFEGIDQATVETEIDLCKARLEPSIFSGVTLWADDAAIPPNIVEGFLLCLLPSLASHYHATTLPPDLAGEGYRELCRQFSRGYNPETLLLESETVTALLLDGVTATGAGPVQVNLIPPISVYASLVGDSGTVSATVTVHGSRDRGCLVAPESAAQVVLGTLLLRGTGGGVGRIADTRMVLCNLTYPYLWAALDAISGTGAAVTATAFGRGRL